MLDIKTEIDNLKLSIKSKEFEIKLLKAHIVYYQDQCKHPIMKKLYSFGDVSYHCETCGYSS